MNRDTKAVIAEWRKALDRHRTWMFLCIAAILILEAWFWRHPPRGYEATDVITVGEAAGDPLVGFAKVWDRLYNDDAFMMDVLARAGWPASESRETMLRWLNLDIRPALTFRMFSAGMAEIKFTQGTIKYVRPVLGAFTAQLLAHLRGFAAREYEKRRYRAGVSMEVISRKRLALQNMFGMFSAAPLLTSDFESADAGVLPIPEMMYASDMASSSFIALAGLLTVDSARLQEAMTLQAWKELTASETGTLVLAPREPMLLTDPKSPPRLVQPLVMLLHLFIPIACLFLFVAGVTLFESTREDFPSDTDERKA